MRLRHILLLGTSLCWVVSACTLNGLPSPDASSMETPTSAPTSTPQLPTPTPLASRGLVTLTVWVPDFLDPYSESAEGSMLLDQIAGFTASNPDIQVDVLVKEASGSGGLYNLLSTAYLAAPSVLPDLVLLNSLDLQAAASKEIIHPLPAFEDAVQRSFPFTVQGVEYEEQFYGAPFLVEMDQAVYTPFSSGTLPLSWTAVLSDRHTMLFPAAPIDNLADDALLSMYMGSGGPVVDEEGAPLLERAHLEELYRFFSAMVDFDLMDPVRVLTLPDAAACWEAYQQRLGTLSYVPAGVYWSQETRKGQPLWVPTRDGDPMAIARFWSFAVVSVEPNRQDAALQLALWLASPEQVSDLSRAVGLLPPARESIARWPLSVEEIEFLETLLTAARPPLPATVSQPVRRALQAGLELLLKGEGTTPEQAATHALTVLRK